MFALVYNCHKWIFSAVLDWVLITNGSRLGFSPFYLCTSEGALTWTSLSCSTPRGQVISQLILQSHAYTHSYLYSTRQGGLGLLSMLQAQPRRFREYGIQVLLTMDLVCVMSLWTLDVSFCHFEWKCPLNKHSAITKIHKISWWCHILCILFFSVKFRGNWVIGEDW